MPECWGHRGASAAFPENTIASFERAIRDGAEGLESDVHVTSDDMVIMFHDPSLSRTTDGKGLIRDQPWKGIIENVRTKAKPHQQIPTFAQVCDLLMRPENRHVKLNIDIKPENDPERLFKLMKETVEKHDNFAEDLSPRLILGLWHPVFLKAALAYLPTLRRVHIGGSPTMARTYFWKHCDGFSMWFPSLVGSEGQNFLADARREGKDVFVWTVNRRDEMIEATRWGVKAILTDKTDMFQNVRQEMQDDFALARSEKVGFFFRWATLQYWMLPQFLKQAVWMSELEGRAGCTFKQAWVEGALDKMDVPPKVTIQTGSVLDSSPASLTTLADRDVPPLSVGKSDLPNAAAITPSMVATA